MSKLGICILVKDTPDYLMKSWIEHHIQLGVSNIWCYVDVNSKPIYQHTSVEYIYLTPEYRFQLEQNGHKYAIYEDIGTHIQEGVYNDCLEKHRNDVDWLACIDDDEFMYIDFAVFDKYSDESCIYLPWKMMYTTDIQCKYNLNNYQCIQYGNLNTFSKIRSHAVKAILNTRVIQYCRTVHFGDLAGVFCSDIEKYKYLVNRNDDNIKNSLITELADKSETNFIYHYKFRSFEEWLWSICDRDDLGDDDPTKNRFNRTIRQWFDTLNEFGAQFDYNEQNIRNILIQLNRTDVLHSPFYDWAKIHPIYNFNEDCLIIFNINKLSVDYINKDDINKIINYAENKVNMKINKIMIVDFLRHADKYDYEIIDRRTVNHWAHNIGNRFNNENMPDLVSIFKKVINSMINTDKHIFIYFT